MRSQRNPATRAFIESRPGQLLRRLLKPPLRVPHMHPPDPAKLLRFPDDDELPPELRDDAIVRRALEAPRRAPAPPAREPLHRPIRNVVLVSHTDFTGNSALHVYRLAVELHRLGYSPAIEVPRKPEGAEEVGRPDFPVVAYGEAYAFPDAGGPDIVHAFSPRELVRQRVEEIGAPYVVHLEDDDEGILAAELGVRREQLLELPPAWLDGVVRNDQVHPHRARRLMRYAAGATVITPRLLELVPSSVPAVAIHAGFDEGVLRPAHDRAAVRRELEIAGDDIVVTYTGSVHATNLEDMRALYTAVAKLRSTGLPIVLVKTGIDAPVARSLPRLGAGIRALGRVPRSRVAELVAAADILVQPGRPGPFDDFRFPSKLPDFLVSGRPVVLPRANIGLALEDGVEALLLEHGDADEIAAAVRRLAEDVELRTRLGAAGRAFAERTLSWADAGRRVADMYVEAGAIGSPMRLELPTGDPRIDLVERHVTGQEGDYRERMLVSLAADADGAVPAAPHGDTDVYRTWVRKRCLYALVTGASVVHVASAHEAVAAVSDAARSFDASRIGRA